jgi:hypothetical protein
MGVYRACIVLLVAGISVGAYAQSPQPVVKFPNDIEFKAPVSPGSQNAVLYGDPTKQVCTFSEPSFHLEPKSAALASRRVAHGRGVVGDALFRCRRTVGRKQAEGVSRRYVLFRTTETPHYVWAKDGEVIIQTTGMGPTGTIMIAQKQ